MGQFDRYMLSQLMVVFGFFSFVLVMVYWINRAVRLFDQLIADGQSAGVFLEFTILSLPSVIKIALPLAAFVGSIYVTNRMSQESELVAVQATGFSPYRLARPIMIFGVVVFLLMSLISHVLVPISTARFDQRSQEIAQNATARLLTPGQFIEPADGVTLFIRNITPEGELQDIFLSDRRSDTRQIIYTAAQAYLLRNETDAQLVMVNGLAQTYRPAEQRLFTTTFDDFALNIGGIIAVKQSTKLRMGQVSTFELLTGGPDLLEALKSDREAVVGQAHRRNAESVLGIAAALIGFSALLVGGFSRFGVWRQIVIAVMLIVVVKGVEASALNYLRVNPSNWFVLYLPTLLGLMLSTALLFLSAHPYLLRRKPQLHGGSS